MTAEAGTIAGGNGGPERWAGYYDGLHELPARNALWGCV